MISSKSSLPKSSQPRGEDVDGVLGGEGGADGVGAGAALAPECALCEVHGVRRAHGDAVAAL